MRRILLLLLLFALTLAGCEQADKPLCEGGHTPGEWTVLLSPTETSEGLRHRVCSVCGVTTESERIEKLTPASSAPSPLPDADTDTAPPQETDPDTAPPQETDPDTAPSAPAPQPLSFLPLPDGTLGVAAADKAQSTYEIPEHVDGVPVTQILPQGFADCTALTTLTLPPTIRQIGTGAFSGCSKLALRETQNGLYLDTALLGIVNPDVDYFAPLPTTTLIADDAFAASGEITSLLLPTTLAGYGEALSRLPLLTAVFTDMTPDAWAAVTGDALPTEVRVYTADTFVFVAGRPVPLA